MSGVRKGVRLGKGMILAVALAVAFVVTAFAPAASAMAYGQLDVGKTDASTEPSISSVPPDEPMVGHFYATGPTGASRNPLPTVTYNYNWSAPSLLIFYSNDEGNSWTVWGTDTTSDGIWMPSTPLPSEGKYYFSVYQAAESVPSDPTFIEAGPYYFDLSPPTSSLDVMTSYWSASSTVHVTATASDSLSGVGYVELWYRSSLDNVTWSLWKKFGNDTAVPWSWNFTMPDGCRHYQLGSRAGDGVGNRQSLQHSDPVIYKCTVPRYLPDPGLYTPEISVLDNFMIKEANVIINISHPADNQLKLDVEPPTPLMAVTLYDKHAAGADFWDTVFDDHASTNISAGTPPYKGSYWPSGGPSGAKLSKLNGTMSAGTWRLWIYDSVAGLGGTFWNWSIVLTPTDGPWPLTAEAQIGYRTQPSSNVMYEGTPYWRGGGTLYFSAAASPAGAVSSVEFWYKYSADNVTWGTWTLWSIDNIAANNWTAGFPYILDGWYRMCSRARSMGLYENLPALYDLEFGRDTAAPASTVAQFGNYWQGAAAATITSTATDKGCGVAKVELYYDYSSDNVTWNGWTLYGNDTTKPWSWSFGWSLGAGYYNFTTRAYDAMGLVESLPGNGTAVCACDNVAPTSNATNEGSYTRIDDTIMINATANDTLTGIAYVGLYYRASMDNVTWTPWTLYTRDYAAPWQWVFDWPKGEGYYEFYTLAVDDAGNVESEPATPDTAHWYSAGTKDTTFIIQGSKIWYNTSPITITTNLTSAYASPLIDLYYRFSKDNATWFSWNNSGQISYPATWSFAFPDGEGYYEVYSLGYGEVAPLFADAIYGYDATEPTAFVYFTPPYWTTTKPFSFTPVASDAGSGVVSVELWYGFSLDNSTMSLNYYAGTSNTAPFTFDFTWPSGPGYYLIGAKAVDRAGNSPFMPSGSAVNAFDNKTPSSSVDAVVPYWTSDYHTYTVQANDEVFDSISYVVLYTRYSSDNATWSTWHPYATMPTYPYQWNFVIADDLGHSRHYQLCSVAVDKAGNREDGPSAPDAFCANDNNDPVTNASFEAPYTRTISPLFVNASGYDIGPSGVDYIDLFWRFSVDNATWGSYSNAGTDPAAPWQWTFSWPSGVGYYQFFTRGTDHANHMESMPSTPDAEYRYNPPIPASHVDQLQEYWQAANPITISATETGSVPATYVELWYSFSSDNSSWGSYSKFANDTAAPWSWSFGWPNGMGFYRLFSRAGNATLREAAHSVPDAVYGRDTVAPATYVHAIPQYYRMASPVNLTYSGSDANSGVTWTDLQYRFSSDNSTWGGWTHLDSWGVMWRVVAFTSWHDFSFSNGTGFYEFRTVSYDGANNIEAYPASADARCCYDVAWPSSNANVPGAYVGSAARTVTATATDDCSGVAEVALSYRWSSDNSTWDGWVAFGTDTAIPWSWLFTMPNGTGYYEFYTIAKDHTGNIEAVPAAADDSCRYISDTAPPASSVTYAIPYWHSTSPLVVNATATDNESSVAYVELWFRRSADNSTWGAWTNFSAYAAVPYSWNFTFPSGQGFYQFYTRACDVWGNYEAAPTSADASWAYDNVAPTASLIALPAYVTSRTFDVTGTATDAGGMAYVMLYYTTNGGTTWTALPTHYTITTIPFTATSDGAYGFYAVVYDLAGNHRALPTAATVPDAETLVDTLHPTVTTSAPSGTNVSVLANITITFSEPMNTTTVESSLTLPSGMTAIYIWDAQNTTLTIHFGSDLPYLTWVNVSVGTGAKDEHGLGLTTASEVSFQTAAQPVTPVVYGSVHGKVIDATGAPISGVTVTLGTTGRTTITDANGNYSFADVTAGMYSIAFACTGYDANTAEATVTAGQAAAANATLTATAVDGGTDSDGGDYTWIIIIIVIVVVVVLAIVYMMFMRKPVKPKGKVLENDGKK